MLGIYFSGTGNSKYCLEEFLKLYKGEEYAISIENSSSIKYITQHNEIVIAYPVYFSNIPKILYDYVTNNQEIWKNKKIFIIATMGLFSGDGAGILARLLEKYGAEVIGGLHIKMPDSIADEKALKRSNDRNKRLIKQADDKIKDAVQNIKNGISQREGLGIWYRMAGFFVQRLYFYKRTKQYSDKLKIDNNKCIGCGLCEKICPMGNIKLINSVPCMQGKCTMCYRCINQCPKQAMTMFGKKVIKQHNINNYII